MSTMPTFRSADLCLQQQESREHRPERNEEALRFAAAHVGGRSDESAQTPQGNGQALPGDARGAAERPQLPPEGASVQSNVAKVARVLRSPNPPRGLREKYVVRLKTASECLELLKDERSLPDGVYSLVEKQMEDRHDASPAAEQRQAAFDVLMAAGLRPETHQRWSRRLATFEDCMELLEKHDSLPGNVSQLVQDQMDVLYEKGDEH